MLHFKKLTMLSAPLLVIACQPEPQTLSEAAKTAIADEVSQRVDDLENAIRQLSLDGMVEVHAQTDELVLAADGEVLAGFAAVREHFEQAVGGATEVHMIESIDPHVYVLGPDAASYTAGFRWSMLSAAGDTMTSGGSWTYVFHRIDGTWKIVHSTGTHLYGEG